MWKKKQHSDNVPQLAVRLCQPRSHASGYPLWTWLGQNSQNSLIPCQSWKLHTQSAGSVRNILIFQVSSHTFHDFSIPKVIFHDFPHRENFYFKFHDSRLFHDLYEPWHGHTLCIHHINQKKQDTLLLPSTLLTLGALVVTHAMLRRLTSWRCIIIIITLPNVHQFSKLFHLQTQQ